MKKLVLYIHGQGGSADECEHYRPLFPKHQVTGLAYQTFTPWETGEEIRQAVERLRDEYESVTLIANSIGAYFSMCAPIGALIRKAYFISPIVDMERLIDGMMAAAGVTEEELKARGMIPLPSGGELSWDYLRYVREHPLSWQVPTEILFGGADALTSRETVAAFAAAHGASLTVMEGGEHWFHTPEQLRFLDGWIRACEAEDEPGAETERLTLRPATRAQMEALIAGERDAELRAAYAEMLAGCLRRPDQWAWHAAWLIAKKDGTRIGDLCFKGLDESGSAEIGYGILEAWQGQGYAAEAVRAAAAWAFRHPAVRRLEAETEPGNRASQRVLEKCGFRPDGTVGQEGPRFVLLRPGTGRETDR